MSKEGGFSQGGFSQGGFSQGGFSQGGFGSPAGAGTTLADGFANPVTMAALVTHRDATVDPGKREGWRLVQPKPPTANMERWEPWVRAAVAQQELLSDVNISPLSASQQVVVESRSAAGAIAKLSAPDVEVFRTAQLSLVLSWADLREERASEILAQVDNQFAFLAAVLHMHPSQMRRTYELLAMAIQFAVSVEMRVKHELGCWRPAEYSPQVQPMITTPGHGALPSGHATQAYMAAYVLQRLLTITPGSPTDVQLQRQAARIATNRVIAGVHFPADNLAGRLLGQALGEYFAARAGAKPSTGARLVYTFKGDAVKAHEFHPSIQPFDGGHANPGLPKPAPFYSTAPDAKWPAVSPLLEHLWAKASVEWAHRKFT